MSLVTRIAPAVFASAMFIIPAAAAPVAPNTLPVDSSLIQVQHHSGHHGGKHSGGKHGGGKHHGGGHHGGKHHGGHHGGKSYGHRSHHHHGRWVAGHRYRSAPPGWRRYGARPWDWQTRGCVLVGPLWFCP